MVRRATGSLGDDAEGAAFRFLIDRGLRPVARNFRSRGGEIDLIMLDGSCLVFVEVRCRRSFSFTDPALTVDYHKQRRIIRTALVFIAARRRFAMHTMRFDVVAVAGTDASRIRWMRDAFRPDDSSL